MNYDDVVAAFFITPEGSPVPPPTVDATPARRLRDALEPIAMHSVWSRQTNERLAGFGHNFMTSYVCSRAALMGEPSPGVVAAAFAVFEPNMITTVYQQGRGVCSRDDLLAARDEATIASLTAVLGDTDVSAVADRLVDAMSVAPGTGRPLFSGLADLPWPPTAIGRLWRATERFREHRGDSHVAACVAAGLDAVEMNVLTELWVGMPLGTYSASRAWTPEQIGAAADRLRARGLLDGHGLNERGLAFRDAIESATDELQASIVDSLGANLDPIVDQLHTWSRRCVEAKAFPPDPYKRAAG